MGKRKRNIKFGPKQSCKNCGFMIPIPMVYCSSKCAETYEKKNEREKIIHDKKLMKLIKKARKKGSTNSLYKSLVEFTKKEEK